MSGAGYFAVCALVLGGCNGGETSGAVADSLRVESARARAELLAVKDSVLRSFTASLRAEVDSLERERRKSLSALENTEDARRRAFGMRRSKPSRS